MKRTLTLALLFCFPALTQVVHAQGAISDGGLTWEWTTNVGGANFTDGTTDHVFRQWWWQQGAGGGATTAPAIMSFPATQTYVGNTATISWNGAAWQREIMATITGGNGTASVLQELTVTNTSGAPANVNLYAYVDNDIAGSANDSALAVNGNPYHVRVSDGTPYSDFLAVGADHFQVQAYNAIATALDAGAAITLNDTGLPFGPGDFTGAFQWDRMIPDGGSVTVYVVFTYSEAGVPPVIGPPADHFIRGDCNNDLATNLVDAVYLLGFLFPQGAPNVLDCDDACDANDDGSLNLVDAVGILNALFGMPVIALPGPSSCDADPTMDTLMCAVPAC